MRLTERYEDFDISDVDFKNPIIKHRVVDHSTDYEDKLGQLEDIEEELGIDLIKFFMGFKKNIRIYYKKGKKIKKGIMTLGILQKYGKTWAFTKEELEK